MPRLLRSSPYFAVANVARSVAYYAAVLGMTPEYVAGSPPQFAVCARDGLAVMLRKVPEPGLIRPMQSQGGTWDAFFWVDDADALYAELVARGADILYGPILQRAYQMREFAIRDCDGHVVGFGHQQVVPKSS